MEPEQSLSEAAAHTLTLQTASDETCDPLQAMGRAHPFLSGRHEGEPESPRDERRPGHSAKKVPGVSNAKSETELGVDEVRCSAALRPASESADTKENIDPAITALVRKLDMPANHAKPGEAAVLQDSVLHQNPSPEHR